MFFFLVKGLNLTFVDYLVVGLISFIISIIVTFFYSLIKNRKVVYIDFINTNNVFYGINKTGYNEKTKKLDDKTKYVECNFILSFYNNLKHPMIWHDISVVTLKNKNSSKLEEGTLNINGTERSLAGVKTYDKLKYIIIKPYEEINYDVNIRLSKDEYLDIKYIYLSYRDEKNKVNYIKVILQKNA